MPTTPCTHRRHARPTGLLVAAALIAGCSGSEERADEAPTFETGPGIAYRTSIEGAPNDAVEDVLEQALRLYTLADRPPSSMRRLHRRAEADVETALDVLRSEGFYEARVESDVAEPPPAPPSPEPVDVDLHRTPGAKPGDRVVTERPAAAPPEATVTLTLEPGPRYAFGRLEFTAADGAAASLPAPADLGFESGAPARAEAVVAAESAAVRWLEAHGHPFARFERRRVVAHPDDHRLDVTSALDPGPKVDIGALDVEGLEDVDETYLRSYREWPDGTVYSREIVQGFQDRLYATGLFSSLSVKPAAEAEIDRDAASPAVPLEVRATERKHRTFGGGLRFNTDTGPAVNGFVEHRNLLGANETARLSITAGLEEQEAGVTFRKPQFLRDRQALVASLVARHEVDEAFEERTVRLHTGIERVLWKRLTVGAGVSAEQSEIDDNDQSGTATLLGLPLTARYDASDSLLDPTRGYRLRAAVTPYTGTFADESLFFTSLDLGGSVYRALDADRRYVLAVRSRLASLVGAERDDVPPTKRLYSGGGGSVRGYESRFIGPLDADGDPEGGRSVAELGVELRTRVTETIGVVPFVEAGTVSQTLFPDFDQGIQLAAGLGFRYYTVVGPLRADVAVPLNPREADDAFQFYISIGQAF